jgi:hypothetical protein
MSDLAEFLLARISEDEEAAQNAGGTGERWRSGATPSTGGWYDWFAPGDRPQAWVKRGNAHDKDTVDHVVRHDPARVLAESDARRRVVNMCEAVGPDLAHVEVSSAPADREELAGGTLRALAVAYAGHPDYRPEWRP